MYHKRFPMKRIIVLIITLALTGSHLSAREQYIYTQISHDEGLTSTINRWLSVPPATSLNP